jgi:putative SOS response-associated peptidase YedK
MCGRYTQSAAADVLTERLGVTLDPEDNEAIVQRCNVAPTELLADVIAAHYARGRG